MTGQPRLSVTACGRDEAMAYLSRHRHHGRPTGMKLALACYDEADGRVCGVAIIGRPVARGLDDGQTWEVNRLCTDGTPNACSALYGAAGRVARVLGLRLVTYTLPAEGGASRRGAGWRRDGELRRDGRGWTSRSGRSDEHPEAKTRWTLDGRRGHRALSWPADCTKDAPLLAWGGVG